MIRSLGWFCLASLGEIGGCFAFWCWLRLGKSWMWSLSGLACLAGFAVALTRVESDDAGRAFAAYGGVYITGSLAWLWLVEGQRPDRWDLLGATLCLVGSAVIFIAHRRP